MSACNWLAIPTGLAIIAFAYAVMFGAVWISDRVGDLHFPAWMDYAVKVVGIALLCSLGGAMVWCVGELALAFLGICK